MESAKPNPPLFWGTLITVVALDLATKLIAAATLSPQHVPHEILGNHRSHATGATQLRHRDGEVEQGEQEVLHA